MNHASLQTLALNAAYERTLDGLLQLLVRGVAQESRVALAQIWLFAPGDRCSSCPMAEDCRERTKCLHLEAAAATSLAGTTSLVSLSKEINTRIPVGVLELGKTAETGEAMLFRNVEEESGWVRDPEWAKQEGIRCLVTQPLVVRGEVIGVLAVYGRAVLTESSTQVLRSFVNHAAAAIANARMHSAIENFRIQLEHENRYLHEMLRAHQGSSALVASSFAMTVVVEQIREVAQTGASVLIAGERGSGKARVAAAIHETSEFRTRPLFTVDCARKRGTVFERLIFGYAKGAFPGALADTPGVLEIADGGSISLENIDALTTSEQNALFQFLQSGVFHRMGDELLRRSQVRVLSSSTVNLEVACEAGAFLPELRTLISAFSIHVPPLRERNEDIPQLTNQFISAFNRDAGGPSPKVSVGEIAELQRYDWPGNVPELRSVVELAMMCASGESLHFDVPGTPKKSQSNQFSDETAPFFTQAEFETLERRNLAAALRKTNGKVAGKGGAAELLGVKPTTLASRIKALGLARPD